MFICKTHKLYYDIQERLVNWPWVKDLLTNRSQIIISKLIMLAVVHLTFSQELVLGPLLFLLYIIDLPRFVSSKVKLAILDKLKNC